jgi:hypothetical protein
MERRGWGRGKRGARNSGFSQPIEWAMDILVWIDG